MNMLTLKEFKNIFGEKLPTSGPYMQAQIMTCQTENGAIAGISFIASEKPGEEMVQYAYVRDFNVEKNGVIRQYRIVNPTLRDSLPLSESDSNVTFIDLETCEDWVEKATAIFNSKEYDARVQVPINLDRDTLHDLMIIAHEKDITLNRLIENIMVDQLNKLEKPPAKESFTAIIEEDGEGNLILPLPDELIKQLGWSTDDALEWIDNHDGSFTLKRVEE
jgi:hypothetical protein